MQVCPGTSRRTGDRRYPAARSRWYPLLPEHPWGRTRCRGRTRTGPDRTWMISELRIRRTGARALACDYEDRCCPRSSPPAITVGALPVWASVALALCPNTVGIRLPPEGNPSRAHACQAGDLCEEAAMTQPDPTPQPNRATGRRQPTRSACSSASVAGRWSRHRDRPARPLPCEPRAPGHDAIHHDQELTGAARAGNRSTRGQVARGQRRRGPAGAARADLAQELGIDVAKGTPCPVPAAGRLEPVQRQDRRRGGCVGCCAFGPPAPPGPCPADPTAGAYGGYAMRLRLGRARLLGGLVGARQLAKGGDTW